MGVLNDDNVCVAHPRDRLCCPRKKGKGVADLEIVAFLCSSAFRDAQKKKKVNTKPWRLALGRTKQKRVQHDVLVRPAVLYCAMEWY